MARILLKNEISHKQIGQAILALAALQDHIRKSISRENEFNTEELVEFFDFVVERVEEEYFDISEMHTQLELDTDEKVYFKYHIDGTNTKGDYFVNVAVPDIGDKRVDLAAVFSALKIPMEDKFSVSNKLSALTDTDQGCDEIYDFSGFAEESLGHIVIFGCGR